MRNGVGNYTRILCPEDSSRFVQVKFLLAEAHACIITCLPYSIKANLESCTAAETIELLDDAAVVTKRG